MYHFYGRNSQRGSTVLASLILVAAVGILSTVLRYGNSFSHVAYEPRALTAALVAAPAPLNLNHPSDSKCTDPKTGNKYCGCIEPRTVDANNPTLQGEKESNVGKEIKAQIAGPKPEEEKEGIRKNLTAQCLPGCIYDFKTESIKENNGTVSTLQVTITARTPISTSKTEPTKKCYICIPGQGCKTQDEKPDVGANVPGAVTGAGSPADALKKTAEAVTATPAQIAEATPVAKQIAEQAAKDTRQGNDAAYDMTNDYATTPEKAAGLAAALERQKKPFDPTNPFIDERIESLKAFAGNGGAETGVGASGGTPDNNPGAVVPGGPTTICTQHPEFCTIRAPGGDKTDAGAALARQEAQRIQEALARQRQSADFGGGAFGGGAGLGGSGLTGGIASFLSGLMRGLGGGGFGGGGRGGGFGGGYGGYGGQGGYGGCNGGYGGGYGNYRGNDGYGGGYGGYDPNGLYGGYAGYGNSLGYGYGGYGGYNGGGFGAGGGCPPGGGYGGYGAQGGYGGQGGQGGYGGIPPGNTIPQQPGACNTRFICTGQTLLYRNNQCVDQPMQQCQFGCNGNQCAQSPNQQQNGQPQGQYGFGTDHQPCIQPPERPDASVCTVGVWRATSMTGNGCTTGWQCVPDSTNAAPPKASLSCQSQTADAGSSFGIAYACQNAVTSQGGGFDTQGQLVGTATVTVPVPPAGTNTATYSLGCRNSAGQTVGAQCSVQISNPKIALTVSPATVPSGATSTVGWVTSGMQSCVVSSPDNAVFTAQNANHTNVNGAATTPPLASTTRMQLSCTTFSGGTRATSTVITVQ